MAGRGERCAELRQAEGHGPIVRTFHFKMIYKGT